MRPIERLERGQTLVMFALTLLLVTLMVMMTLSFSSKAKDKMELQQVADQAAYSNAVVTARTFNAIAIMNRVEIACMVAIAGIQAALSYAALYRGFLTALTANYITMAAVYTPLCVSIPLCSPPPAPTPSCFCIAMGLAQAGLVKVFALEALATIQFETLDWLVALEAMSYQASAMAVFAFEQNTFVMLVNRLDDQALTRDIVSHASAGLPEWTVPGGGATINKREVGDITEGLGGVMGAAMQANLLTNRASVYAAMASRGNWWVSGRLFEMAGIQIKLQLAFLPDLIIIAKPNAFIGDGSAYFGPTVFSNTSWNTTNDTAVVAHDYGIGIQVFNIGCVTNCAPIPIPLPLFAYGEASAGLLPTHVWFGNGIPFTELVPKHFLAPTDGVGVWPHYIDYNFAKVAMVDDAFGQPKNFSVVQRNYRNRAAGADPWNLLFNFRMSSSSPGSEYGQGEFGDRGGLILGDGTDVSLQTALSTGIAYYHRYGHWKEPPNLFNPFWRAGLSRANIDPKPMDGVGRDWFEDVEEALNSSGVPWAAEAVQALDNVGYRGVQ